MDHVLLDALLDSLKVLLFVFIFNFLLSFFEDKLTKKIENSNKINPLTGSIIGLIPQCGVSVISADLYVKNHITLGTIVAVFIACSDEAIPMILSESDKIIYLIPLILIKLFIGLAVGFLVDLIYKKSKEKVLSHKEECEHEHEVKIGCCNHEINSGHVSKIKRYFIHPLIHSLKLFIYIFVFNLIFGTIIYFVGENNFTNILESNKYFTPIYATMIGLIPNCASSVLITNMFIGGKLSLGTTIAGLITNSGLGILVILKNKKMIKKAIVIMTILVLTALVSGYVINLIFGF